MTGQDIIDLIKEHRAENTDVFVSVILDDGRILNWDTDVQLRIVPQSVRDEDSLGVYSDRLLIEAHELPF